MKQSLSLLTTFILGAIIFGVAGVVLAWTGPTQTAPNGNVSAPVNVGTVDQVKNAGLSLNSLAIFGNAILSGVSRYLNFGTTAGSGGYGLRDNAGIIEFKHSGGSWLPFVSNTVPGTLTTGFIVSTSTTATSTFAKGINVTGFVKATSGFTFPDGTTQTTAASPGIYGWEHRINYCSSSSCSVNCTAGKKLLGGGCDGAHYNNGGPNGDSNFECKASSSVTGEVHAFCAYVI